MRFVTKQKMAYCLAYYLWIADLAAGVALSRIHRGEHYPFPVIGRARVDIRDGGFVDWTRRKVLGQARLKCSWAHLVTEP